MGCIYFIRFARADSHPLSSKLLDAENAVKLVAETSADGDLVTALSATAAEHCGTCLGLHAGKEAVSLGAVAAIGLKGTLRHDKKLLRRGKHLLKLLGCCNNL